MAAREAELSRGPWPDVDTTAHALRLFAEALIAYVPHLDGRCDARSGEPCTCNRDSLIDQIWSEAKEKARNG